jgi:hypothetical protein
MIKKKVLDQIRVSPALIGEMAEIRNVDIQTVQRWLRNNHVNLMHIKIIKAVCSYFGIAEGECYE